MTIDEQFLPGDRVEILKGATLQGGCEEITITGLVLATVVSITREMFDGREMGVILDESPGEHWYCYASDVRAWIPEREEIHELIGYDS
jgi:hypothetical protein